MDRIGNRLSFSLVLLSLSIVMLGLIVRIGHQPFPKHALERARARNRPDRGFVHAAMAAFFDFSQRKILAALPSC